MAKRAGETVRKELGRGGSGGGGASRGSGPSDAHGTEKAWAKQARDVEKAEKDKTRAVERETKRREDLRRRSSESAGRWAMQEADAEGRAANKIALTHERAAQKVAASRTKMWGGAARGAGNAIGGAASGGVNAALGAGRHVMGGMGFNFDPGHAAQAAGEFNAKMIALSASGYMPSEGGEKAIRQDPRALGNDISKVANETGTDMNVAASGMAKFVELTGDLPTARATFADIAKIAKATGTDLDDAAAAAAGLSNALPEDQKVEGTLRLLKLYAGQGKAGAVELKNLASGAGTIVAASKQFGGDKERNLALMGVFAQQARQLTKSPAQALVAVQGFANVFTKGTREKAFKAAGIHTRDAHGNVRDAQTLLTEAIVATKGDTLKMGKMFNDVSAQRVTGSYSSKFRDVYQSSKAATEEGKLAEATAAVTKMFDDLINVKMSDKQIDQDFKNAMDQAGTDAIVANNKYTLAMSDIVAQLRPVAVDLAGSLLGLMPAIKGVASGFAAWAKEDPIGLAIVAGAAKIPGPIGMLASSLLVGVGIIDGLFANMKAKEVARVMSSVHGAEHRGMVLNDVRKIEGGGAAPRLTQAEVDKLGGHAMSHFQAVHGAWEFANKVVGKEKEGSEGWTRVANTYIKDQNIGETSYESAVKENERNKDVLGRAQAAVTTAGERQGGAAVDLTKNYLSGGFFGAMTGAGGSSPSSDGGGLDALDTKAQRAAKGAEGAAAALDGFTKKLNAWQPPKSLVNTEGREGPKTK